MQATAKQNPLDVLVMSQLSAIRRDEAVLRREVARGNSGNIEAELLNLRERAERLNRMMDAMSLTGGYWSESFNPGTAA